MSPALQHCAPQQVVAEAQGCPLHGSGLHLPCAQNGVGDAHCTLHPPQCCGSFCGSTQATPLQQVIPGSHVGQFPPLELLPLEEPLPPEELPPPDEPLPLPEPLPDPLPSTDASPAPGDVDPPQLQRPNAS